MAFIFVASLNSGLNAIIYAYISSTYCFLCTYIILFTFTILFKYIFLLILCLHSDFLSRRLVSDFAMSTKCISYSYMCLLRNICDLWYPSISTISSTSSKRTWSCFNKIFSMNRVTESCSRSWEWCNKWRDGARCLSSQWRRRCRTCTEFFQKMNGHSLLLRDSFIITFNIASNE